MKTGANPIERYKAEKGGLELLDEIEELAATHGGWETLEPGDRERLKWIGVFFRKPTPGRFMMRVRITNGQATSHQLRVLADMARRTGNGRLDLTTRQQIELRAFRIQDVPEMMDALKGVDLTSLQTGMDNIRNVNTCPMAGLTPLELFDASPAGMEYTRIFLGSKEFTNLPRKFNVTMTGCLENCTHAETQDVGMTPALRSSDGAKGFNVVVGGKMGSGGMTVARPLDVFVEPQDAARLAAEITLLFRDEGPRESRSKIRFAFLVQDWGVERLRAALEKRWGRPLEHAQRDMRLARTTDHLGVRRQRERGLFSVGLCVPTGRITSDQLEELARLADAYGTGHVRLTLTQNPILVNVQEEKLPALLEEPLLKQFPADPHPFFRGLVACTGTDYCNLAQIESKGIGQEVTEMLAKKFPGASALTMHWSGCCSGCGNHQAADLGFVGGKARVNGEIVDAVHIFAGGRTGLNPRAGVKIRELVPVSDLAEVLPGIVEELLAAKEKERAGLPEPERTYAVPQEAMR